MRVGWSDARLDRNPPGPTLTGRVSELSHFLTTDHPHSRFFVAYWMNGKRLGK